MESFTQLPGPKVPAFRRSLKQWEQDLPQRHNDQPWGYEVLNSTHIKITKADEPFRMQKALPLMSAYCLLVLRCFKHESFDKDSASHTARKVSASVETYFIHLHPGRTSLFQAFLPRIKLQLFLKGEFSEAMPKLCQIIANQVLAHPGIPTHGNAKSVPHSSRSRWR